MDKKKYSVGVCQSTECSMRLSRDVLKRAREYVEEKGLKHIDVVSCGCLSECENGPNIKIENHIIGSVEKITGVDENGITKILDGLSPDTELIHPDMTVHEIIEKVPEASMILADFQLGCFDCSIGSFETLREGVLSHGMTETDLNEIVAQINHVANIPKVYIDVEGVTFTETAFDKVIEFMKDDPQKRKNLALRIEAITGTDADRIQYFFDLVTDKKDGEKVIKQGDMTMYISDKNRKHFSDKYIDFQETMYGAGFKVEKK